MGEQAPPGITIAHEVIASLAKAWSTSVVIKLLGKVVAYPVLERRLRDMWLPSGKMVIMDFANGYSVVRFDIEDDY
ncbi:hypothetical protein V2J09_022613 [Rumex salicifolius]